ncbi:hypothetical protein [Streptomyces melanosporofaciens]|uniref:hypothetical protein n=1 Tax=Streptomyces melanosporofaciens TaxID=67327 RepID=UPI00115FFDF1|nr:hypothetical protein [Streptomyces melanosporofaciens]
MLAVADQNPSIIQGELSATLAGERPHMTPAMDGSATGGLATRRSDERDGRARWIYLTCSGVDLLREPERMHERHVAESLGKADRDHLM